MGVVVTAELSAPGSLNQPNSVARKAELFSPVRPCAGMELQQYIASHASQLEERKAHWASCDTETWLAGADGTLLELPLIVFVT